MASYALNAPPSVPLTYITLFGTGALIMRGAGCTINDLWDRNLDTAVGTSRLAPPSLPVPTLTNLYWPCAVDDVHTERTKTRPLARKDISPRHAFAFLAPQLAAGLAVLTQLNWYRCVYIYMHTRDTCSKLVKRQYRPRRFLPLLSDHIPIHETYHLLAPSRPRCVPA
jgi:4-hydroxybenzoate polyprenyltransferase